MKRSRAERRRARERAGRAVLAAECIFWSQLVRDDAASGDDPALLSHSLATRDAMRRMLRRWAHRGAP